MTEEPQFAHLKSAFVHTLYESNQQLIYVADRKVAALLLINAVLVSFSGAWTLGEYASSTVRVLACYVI